jgi:hypothetical protein
VECLGQRLDAELGAVGADETDLAGTDSVVDPRLVGRGRDYWCSLRGKGVLLPVADGAEESRHPRTGVTPALTGRLRSTSVDHGAPYPKGCGGRVGRRNPRGGPLSDLGCAVRVTHVSSLWTPGGEHRVDPQGDPQGRAAPAEPTAAPSADAAPEIGAPAELSDEEAAVRAELDEVRRQLAQVPAEVVVANHAMGLYELAAIHLSAEPPNAEAAKLAIDAMGALVDGLTGRLGEPENTLRDALAQLRLAFVQVTSERA